MAKEYQPAKTRVNLVEKYLYKDVGVPDDVGLKKKYTTANKVNDKTVKKDIKEDKRIRPE